MFFLCSSKERTKERAPEMTNFAISYARYTFPRSTEMPKFRSISGLPPRSVFVTICSEFKFLDFKPQYMTLDYSVLAPLQGRCPERQRRAEGFIK
jgi:hypothetical protein